jgi:hypothetical protein
MSRVAGFAVESNPHSGQYEIGRGAYRFAPGERAALDQVHAELNAGRFVRCPKCHDWFNKRKLGAAMTHTLRDPKSGRALRFVAFGLCRRCWKKSDLGEIVEAVTSYFDSEDYQEVRS